MSNNPFTKLYEEIQDARSKIDTAMVLVRKQRALALERKYINMAIVFKEIDTILKSVLEE